MTELLSFIPMVTLKAKDLNHLQNFRTRTILYGSRSIKSKAVFAWNCINTELHHLKLQNLSKGKCREEIFKFLLDKYEPTSIWIVLWNPSNILSVVAVSTSNFENWYITTSLTYIVVLHVVVCPSKLEVFWLIKYIVMSLNKRTGKRARACGVVG